jgi:D-amino-acid dehydrogenase
MSPVARQVIVVGGGVIGAACAYYLSRSGWNVTIVERTEFGKGCSHANCGLVCPSHVLPLAEPGAAWKAFKALWGKNSPFYIKPRFDPTLWGWLLRFARRCNRSDMLEAGGAIQKILESSMSLYRELIAGEALDCEWETRGLLFVFRTPAAFEEYGRTNRLMEESFGLPAKRFDGNEVNELEPALKPGLAGGWYYEHDAHLRPDKLLASLRRVLELRGVAIREQCEVQGFVRDGGRANGILTNGGAMTGSAFVVAAGALTPLLGNHLGCKIPIQPGKGYSITMPRPAQCPAIPLIFPEHRVAVTPMQSGYRLGSTMEFAGYDTTIHRPRLDLLKEGAGHYLREPYCEPMQEEWYGWRPMTYDGKPIIGRSPAMENVLVAAGHNMLGLSMAPATGKLIAELLNGERPHIDPAPYAVNRF